MRFVDTPDVVRELRLARANGTASAPSTPAVVSATSNGNGIGVQNNGSVPHAVNHLRSTSTSPPPPAVDSPTGKRNSLRGKSLDAAWRALEQDLLDG